MEDRRPGAQHPAGGQRGVLEDTLLGEGWRPRQGAGPGALRASPPPSGWLPRARWPGRPPKALPMAAAAPGHGLRIHVQACSLGVQGHGARRRAGCGRPQTKVAWCGLALGLAGPPATGLRPGRSGAGGLLACGLRGPIHTPGALQPGPGAEPVTKSTSMIVLTGRPRLLWALPPVTGRRERLSPSPLGLQTPRRSPHPPALHGHWPWDGFLKCPNASRRLATPDLSLGRGQGSADRQPQAPAPRGPLHVRVAEALADATQCGEGPRPRGRRHESSEEGRGWGPSAGGAGPRFCARAPGEPLLVTGTPRAPCALPSSSLCQASPGPSKAVQHLGPAPPAPAPLIPPLPLAPPGRPAQPRTLNCPWRGCEWEVCGERCRNEDFWAPGGAGMAKELEGERRGPGAPRGCRDPVESSGGGEGAVSTRDLPAALGSGTEPALLRPPHLP